jgi:hypothetical protein
MVIPTYEKRRSAVLTDLDHLAASGRFPGAVGVNHDTISDFCVHRHRPP